MFDIQAGTMNTMHVPDARLITMHVPDARLIVAA